MSEDSKTTGYYMWAAVVTAASIIIAYIKYKGDGKSVPRNKAYNNNGLITKLVNFINRQFKNPFKHLKVEIVKSNQECSLLCERLNTDVKKLRVLGFDCEWVSEGSKQRPIALMQLATHSGLCGLIRLSLLKCIPPDLKEILEDRRILKVGVGCVDDAKQVFRDYNVQVQGCLDLRHIITGGSGLAKLAKNILGVELNKHWKIVCSDWEAEELTHKQIDYAAKDALVAIEIMKTVIRDNSWSWFSMKSCNTQTLEFLFDLEKYIDIKYRAKPNKISRGSNKYTDRTKQSIGFSTRKSPLYHNCYMYAPDDQLLCCCDPKKAEWYVARGLADHIGNDPYSIRLKFEPAGRSAYTYEGRFYTHLKTNRCVVCGKDESYLRHNVVPREYRIHFPDIMKNHQSHDIVLMCLPCHKLAAEHDFIFKQELANLCDAPMRNDKLVVDEVLTKVQKAAKALLAAGDKLPTVKKKEFENIVMSFCKTDNLDKEQMQEILTKNNKLLNINYESHGFKVVNYFINSEVGLLELEKRWRQHFLNTMAPKYLPYLWSVSHNHERLAVRAAENRVSLSDLKIAGLDDKAVALINSQCWVKEVS